jgi:hypothetical protein
MPDPIKDLYQSLKTTNLFLDEQDLRDQLSKAPKDVYAIVSKDKAAGGLFLDYDDFESALSLKKKEPSPSGANIGATLGKTIGKAAPAPSLNGGGSAASSASPLPLFGTQPKTPTDKIGQQTQKNFERQQAESFADVEAAFRETMHAQRSTAPENYANIYAPGGTSSQEAIAEMQARDKANLQLAEQKKNAIVAQKADVLSAPVKALIQSGEHKKFFDATGNFKTGEAIQYFDKVVKEKGGGSFVRDMLVAGLRDAGGRHIDQGAKEDARKGSDSAIKATGRPGLLGKSLASGFYRGLSMLGNHLASGGVDNTLSRYLQGKDYEAEALSPGEYKWNKKEWLDRATTSAGTSLGASLPVMLPSAAITIGTGGIGGVAVGGTLGFLGERAMNSGGVYDGVLKQTGDPTAAAKAADDFARKQAVTLPLYYLDALVKLKLFKPGVKGVYANTLNAGAHAGFDYYQELATELWQGYTEAQANGYTGSFQQYTNENSDTALDVLASSVGSSVGFSAAGKIYRTLGQKTPAAKAQFYTEVVQKEGPEVATQIIDAQASAGELTPEQAEREKQEIGKVASQVQSFEQLGIKGEDAKAYVALSTEVQELKEQLANTEDPAIRSALELKIKQAEGGLNDLAQGKGRYAVVIYPGGARQSAVIPLVNLQQMERTGEADELIQTAEAIEIVGDEALNKKYQERKAQLGNADAPEGFYQNSAVVIHPEDNKPAQVTTIAPKEATTEKSKGAKVILPSANGGPVVVGRKEVGETSAQPLQENKEVKKTFDIDGNTTFYHASEKPRQGRLHMGTAPQFGTGVYFSTSKKKVTHEFGEEVTEAELALENPVHTNTKEWHAVQRRAIELADKAYAKRKGLTESDIDEDLGYYRYDPDNDSELGEIDAHFISDAAKELGYDAIIDKGSKQYENEIIVLDESKIVYPEDKAAKSETQPAAPQTVKVFRAGKKKGDVTFYSKTEDYAHEYNDFFLGGEAEVQGEDITFENPMVVELSDEQFTDINVQKPYIAEAKKAGHDVVIFKNSDPEGGYAGEEFYAVIKSNQGKNKANASQNPSQPIPSKEAAPASAAVSQNSEAASESHAQTIKGRFRQQFKQKGVSDEHIDAAIALMDTRAEVWSKETGRPAEEWYDRIADVKGGEFEAGTEKQFQIAGEKAVMPEQVRQNLYVARKMEAGGKDTKTIWAATGWEKGADGKWRYEIADGKLKDGWRKKVAYEPADLEDIFDGELLKAYPQLKGYKVEIDDDNGWGGAFNPQYKTIKVTYPLERDKLGNVDQAATRVHRENIAKIESILLHELQHAIQDIEGFASGGSPAQFSMGRGIFDDNSSAVRLYRRIGGEVEARNVQTRQNMDADAKKATPLSETEDVARSEQLLFFDKKVSAQTEGGTTKGATETLKDGRVVIHALTSPDFSTLVHEIAHVFEKDLTAAEKEVIEKAGGSEAFARGFERYLRDGKAPNESLQALFDKFKTWLTEIYKTLKGSPIEKKVSPEVRQIFERLLTPTPTPSKAEEKGVGEKKAKFREAILAALETARGSEFEEIISDIPLQDSGRKQGVRNLREGKRTKAADAIEEAIEKMWEDGYVYLNRGRGDHSESFQIPIEDFLSKISETEDAFADLSRAAENFQAAMDAFGEDLFGDTVEETIEEVVSETQATRQEGIRLAFEQNPELAATGTGQEYAAYLDSVFPDSKAPDVVYHGSNKKIERFSNRGTAIFFGSRANKQTSANRRFTYAALLDIRRPATNADVDGQLADFIKTREELPAPFDGFIGKAASTDYYGSGNEYIVFSPDQIHILGSSQDVAAFKQWKQNNTNDQPTTPQSTASTEAVTGTTKDAATGSNEAAGTQSSPQATAKPKRKASDKLRDLADKVEKEGIKFLKADLPEGTQLMGFGGEALNKAIASAMRLAADAWDAGASVEAAIEQGFAQLRDYFEKNTKKFDEGKLRREFDAAVRPALEEAQREGTPVVLSHKGLQDVADEFDLEDVQKRPHKSDEQLRRDADDTIAKWKAEGRYAFEVEALIQQAEKKGILTDEERVIVEQHLANLVGQARAAKGDKGAYTEKLNQIRRVKRAGEITRSAAGAALRLPINAGSVPQSVEEALADYMEATGTAVLTEAQQKEVEEKYAKLEVALEEEKRLRAEAEAKADELEAEIEVQAAKAARKANASGSKKGAQKDYKKEREDLKAKIKEKWNKAANDGTLTAVPLPYAKQLAAIAPDVARLMKSYVEEGVTTLSALVDKMHEDLKGVNDAITKDDVRDLIAGKYNAPRKTKTEIMQQVQELRDEQKYINQLNALLAGEEPKSERKKRARNGQITELQEKIKAFHKAKAQGEALLRAEREAAKREEERLTREFEREQKAAEKKRLKAEADKAKKLSKELDKKTPDERGLQTLLERNQKRTKELQEKLAKGDYAPAKRPASIIDNKELQKKHPELYKQVLDAIRAKEQAAHELELAAINEKLANRTKWQKGIAHGGKFFRSAKALKAGIDDSGIGVQTLFALLANPVAGAKAIKEHALDAASAERFERNLARLHASDWWPLIEASGLSVVDPKSLRESEKGDIYNDTYFDNKFKIKGKDYTVGQFTTKPFERAFTSLGNNIRVNIFLRQAKVLLDEGKTFESHPDEFKSVAAVINNMSGRGTMNEAIEKHNAMMSAVLWSPRLLASSLNLLGVGDVVMPMFGQKGFYASLTPRQRWYVAEQVGWAVGTGVMIMAALAYSDDDNEVDMDPTSVTFGTVKVGEYRYTLFGRYNSVIRMLAMYAMGERKTARGTQQLDEKAYGASTGKEVWKFVRGKLNPTTAIGVDYLLKETYDGKKPTVKGTLSEMFTPLSLSEAGKAIEQDGAMGLLKRGLPSFVGVKVSNEQDFKVELLAPATLKHHEVDIPLTPSQQEVYAKIANEQYQTFDKKLKATEEYQKGDYEERTRLETRIKTAAKKMAEAAVKEAAPDLFPRRESVEQRRARRDEARAEKAFLERLGIDVD